MSLQGLRAEACILLLENSSQLAAGCCNDNTPYGLEFIPRDAVGSWGTTSLHYM